MHIIRNIICKSFSGHHLVYNEKKKRMERKKKKKEKNKGKKKAKRRILKGKEKREIDRGRITKILFNSI